MSTVGEERQGLMFEISSEVEYCKKICKTFSITIFGTVHPTVEKSLYPNKAHSINYVINP